MKRLISLSGPGGRGILELGGNISFSGPSGRLHLVDKKGNLHPIDTPPAETIGAFLTANGSIAMQGSLAGYSALMAKARTSLMMSLMSENVPSHKPSVPQKPITAVPQPALDTQPMPKPQQRQPSPSAALLEILQKAAELFPPEPSPPPSPPEPDDRIANPFPEAFPFSRWRRVEYPGTDRCYLEGEARHKGMDYVIHALPGDRRHPAPAGYNRFLRARDGSGFWVRVRRKS